MVTGEVSGTPAVYRCADVLCRGDKNGADDKEWDSVAVMKSIYDVVVVSHVQLEDSLRHRQQAVDHLVCPDCPVPRLPHSCHRECFFAAPGASALVNNDGSNSVRSRHFDLRSLRSWTPATNTSQNEAVIYSHELCTSVLGGCLILVLVLVAASISFCWNHSLIWITI